MTRHRPVPLVLSVLAAASTPGFVKSQLAQFPTCDAPEYFGICDPFVPGVFIRVRDRQAVEVLDTWPSGPAEIAGICAGDKIVAINSASTLDISSNEILRSLISDAAGAVTLSVLRGQEKKHFNVFRERESTLAKLSQQKFLSKQLVPFDQSAEGLTELNTFIRRIDDRHYLREVVEGFWVPKEIPDGLIQSFLKLIENAKAKNEVRSLIPAFDILDNYSLGFSLFSLADSQGVWLHQVFPKSPAHQKGLFPGDRLVALNGRELSKLSEVEIAEIIFSRDGPKTVQVEVKRFGAELKLQIETNKASNFADLKLDPNTGESIYRQRLPSRLARSSQTLITGMHVLYAERPHEAIIAEVEFPSIAFNTGLRIGDVILEIDGLRMAELTREQVESFLTPVNEDVITIKISRLGKELVFQFSPVTYGEALSWIGRKLTRFGPLPEHCPD